VVPLNVKPNPGASEYAKICNGINNTQPEVKET